jgi:hypothetical protein
MEIWLYTVFVEIALSCCMRLLLQRKRIHLLLCILYLIHDNCKGALIEDTAATTLPHGMLPSKFLADSGR